MTSVDASAIKDITDPKPNAATSVSNTARRCTGVPRNCGPPASTMPTTATATPANCSNPGRSPTMIPTLTGTATPSDPSGETTPIGPRARAL